MDKWIEHIISMPELSEEQLDDLRRAVATDADLARFAGRWQRFRALARRRLDEEMGDSRLFYLYALHRAGRSDVLTPEERKVMDELPDRYEPLLERRSAIALIAEDVRESADLFSSMWDARVSEERPRDGSDTTRLPRERMRATKVSPREAARRSRPRSTAARWMVRGAIALAVMAFAFVLTQVIRRDTGMTTVRTADDEVRMVELAAGSRVRLLESSELTYFEPTSASSLLRQASVVGRAYFEITSEERGFIVKTPNARITVLGTTFGVEAFERLTEVVLADGRLTLASEGDLEAYVALEPGQMSRVVTGSPPIEPLAVELSERLDWTGLFVFHSTPLRSIANHLSAFFRVPITIEGRIAEDQITGTFEQSQPLEEILAVIAEAVDADVSTQPSGGLVIRRR